jgi:anti-sigma factor RsiW
MRRWIDELSFRARVVLTILIVAITITIAVISWDDIGNWKAAFEAAGTKILRWDRWRSAHARPRRAAADCIVPSDERHQVQTRVARDERAELPSPVASILGS